MSDPVPASKTRDLATRERSGSLLDETILTPGVVRINVQGAFILDGPETSEDGPGGHGTHPDSRDIRLPNHRAVVSHVALDIGGSLAKLVYFTHEPDSKESGGRLSFLKFETENISKCFEFVQRLKIKQQALNGSSPSELCVMATGGGAYKFYDEMQKVLDVEVLREDEMDCLIMGLNFFITEIPREVFTYSEAKPLQFQEPRAHIYPYLLVNIGSGVSMVKVPGPKLFERIGGTSLGGGTLWGLLSLLTGAGTFDQMLEMADKGDNTSVDMLVGDIYGTDYGKIGLKTTTIASSFGKVLKMKRQGENAAEDGNGLSSIERTPSNERHTSERPFTPEDISRSLLYAISNNIGQIAYLQCEKHNLEHIYFGGSFIRGHQQTMSTLSYAIRFWSNGKKKAYFLRHEGYLGSVGAFLKRQPRN